MRIAKITSFTKTDWCFAGSHLIIDLWEAEGLDDKDRIEQAMIDAVEAAGATLLHIHLHTFTPSGGVSGVAVLAESHISVHTWPERGYAAFDISCAATAEPRKAFSVLKQAFAPKRVVPCDAQARSSISPAYHDRLTKREGRVRPSRFGQTPKGPSFRRQIAS
jgi:S-adenosylmethionine decarboxylase